MKFHKNGIPQMVVVDDALPVKGNKCAFAQGSEPEMWVLALEKAWAKIHGSYERIEGGVSSKAIRDLTGAPYENFTLKNVKTDAQKQDLWIKVLKAYEQDFIISVSVESHKEADLYKWKAVGLLSQHSYSIIKVKDVGVAKLC